MYPKFWPNSISFLQILDRDQTTEEEDKSEEEDNNVAASELLLELMVKIAAHPDQWDDVHELLRKYFSFRC